MYMENKYNSCTKQTVSLSCLQYRNNLVLWNCFAVGIALFCILLIWLLVRKEDFYLCICLIIGFIFIILICLYLIHSTLQIFSSRGYA